MRLSSYVQRTRALGEFVVSKGDIDVIEDQIKAGASLADVLRKYRKRVPPRALLGLWRAHTLHTAHDEAIMAVVARRKAEGQTPMPIALLKQTVTAHELDLLERAEVLAPAGSVAEHRRRDGIKEARLLWNACLAITRKEGRLAVEVSTEDATLVEEFGDYTGTTSLAEVAPHRWLAIRRGERAGALSLSLDLPSERLVNQVEARGAELRALAPSRTNEELLASLVIEDLPKWAMRLKDNEARLLATRSASAAYHNLLCAPKPPHKLLAGVWVPRPGGQLAVAISTEEGELVHSGKVAVGDDPVKAVESQLGGHAVEAIVLPVKSDNDEVLRALDGGFGVNLPTIRVLAVAMKAGQAALGQKLAPAIGNALVLARRATQPMRAWGELDPTILGLAEYQEELDVDLLRHNLEEIRDVARAGIQPEELSAAASAAPRKAARAAPKPLNPMIKTVDDLRPGMEVNGVVTNITQFGAFLNIGLGHEGLVHVSELADHFVNDPNEVVRVGQEVSARVLGVDRGRRRISLSLRGGERSPGAPGASPPGAPLVDGKGVPLDDIPGRRGRRGGGRGGFGGGGPRRQPVTGASRTQALADLEALFKKE